MGKAKIDAAMKNVLENGDKVFVPYIMAGDGGLENLKEQILFLQDCGSTVVELGIPFTDPVADGPVIQQAGLRSLANGTTLEGVLQSLAEWKEERTIPIVLMLYCNLVYTYGIERFAKRCVEVGVDGLIIPDVPMEEEEMLAPVFSENKIALIRLASPTSPRNRLERIGALTEGFLYAVTVKGTTGARTQYADELPAYLQTLKTISSAPVLAGFGVSSPEQVKELSQYSDGVIVGSKIVELLAAGKREEIRKIVEAAKVNITTLS